MIREVGIFRKSLKLTGSQLDHGISCPVQCSVIITFTESRGDDVIHDPVGHDIGNSSFQPITDLDLKFSLETVNCLGCCALGPVMEIGGKPYGKMKPGKTADVLKNYD